MTLLPPTVLMRLRNPWVFALLRRFGWYVRFIRLLHGQFKDVLGIHSSISEAPKTIQPATPSRKSVCNQLPKRHTIEKSWKVAFML